MDRAFYRAALFYAKMRNAIVNNRIVVDLKNIVERLIASIGNKIMSVGVERAKDMLVRFEEKGVFRWAPNAGTWLRETAFVIWLGLGPGSSGQAWITS